MEIIQREQTRLAEINAAVDNYCEDRNREIAKHDGLTAELEQERLRSVDWKEKNALTERLVTHGHHTPRKYLLEFRQIDSPYFGVIGIHDSNPRIGKKEYLIGLQSLVNGTKVHVVDWRKAEISKFFYDGYEEGEEYEETINGVDREGVITRRANVDIVKRTVKRVETPADVYEVINGEWCRNGISGGVTADMKCESENHQMVDNIAKLISPEQFRTITKQHTGVVLLTGGAGSGKTTVALHRLSFLIFDKPQSFRPEKCLVLMFNRSLRNYVKRSSDSLLEKVPVETFSSWALNALYGLGINSLKTALEDHYTPQKKRLEVPALLAGYAKRTSRIEPVADLWRFYCDEQVASVLVGADQKEAFIGEASKKGVEKSRQLSFADISVLLRLAQFRQPEGKVVPGSFGHYDHIVIDEAQDFSSLDLEIILAATSQNKSMTIAADEKQQILNFVDSSGFASFKNRLHTLGLDRESLTVSYRCPKEIADLASRVIGRDVDTAKAHKGVLEYHRGANRVVAIERLKELAIELYAADPKSLTAIICKKKLDVKDLQKALQGIPGLHQEGEMCFEPGVMVTNGHQVKGLEFTNVVLWDPAGTDYRHTAVDRNLLYVAITRACKRLDIVHWRTLAKGLGPTVA